MPQRSRIAFDALLAARPSSRRATPSGPPIAEEMGRLVDPLRGRDHWHRVRSIIRKRIGYEPVGAGMRWPDA